MEYRIFERECVKKHSNIINKRVWSVLDCCSWLFTQIQLQPNEKYSKYFVKFCCTFLQFSPDGGCISNCRWKFKSPHQEGNFKKLTFISFTIRIVRKCKAEKQIWVEKLGKTTQEITAVHVLFMRCGLCERIYNARIPSKICIYDSWLRSDWFTFETEQFLNWTSTKQRNEVQSTCGT